MAVAKSRKGPFQDKTFYTNENIHEVTNISEMLLRDYVRGKHIHKVNTLRLW